MKKIPSRAVVAASVLVALAGACAETEQAEPIPTTGFYFPLGITTFTTPDGTFLAVSNSNFDQRYASANILTLDVDQFASLAGSEVIVDVPMFDVADSVRVHTFTGDLLYLEDPGTDANGFAREGRMYVAARGKNRVTMIDVDSAGGFFCGNSGAPLIDALDCSEGRVIRTFFDDPFSLAAAPAADAGQDLIMVGHLSAPQDNNVPFGRATLIEARQFDERLMLEREMGVTEDDQPGLAEATVSGLGGISGLAYIGQKSVRDAPSAASFLMTANSRNLLLGGLQVENLNSTDGAQLQLGSSFRLDVAAAAQFMRGIAVADTSTVTPGVDRAYVTLRYFASGNSFDSGIAVMDITDPQDMKLLSILEMGEELQRPFLVERTIGGSVQRLLYIGDTSLDRIFIVDVSTDRPVLVGTLKGREIRTDGDETFNASVLDAPTQFAFAEVGASTLAFVSNFANSTVAVLDVTSPDPKQHRQVGRLGVAVDPAGDSEGP